MKKLIERIRMKGNCFRDAIETAGVSIPANLFIPDWILIDEIPAICESLDLKWHGNGTVKLDIEPVIVLYRTHGNKGHAIFTNDIEPFLDYNIVGLICFNRGRNEG